MRDSGGNPVVTVYQNRSLLVLLLPLSMVTLGACGENRSSGGPPSGAECNDFPQSYTRLAVDVSALTKATPQGLEGIVSRIEHCYPAKPYRSPEFILRYRETVKTEDGRGRYLVYELLGFSHVRLLFRVSPQGELEGAYRTSQPYQQVIDSKS